MTTLREEAEKAGHDADTAISGLKSSSRQMRAAIIATAIERVARATAERAIRSMFEVVRTGPHGPEVPALKDPRARNARNDAGEIIGPNYFGPCVLGADAERWPLTVDDFVRDAIAAVERGE